MKTQEFIYTCPVLCPINKHCFVIKLMIELKEPLTVLKKCEAKHGKDIAIVIGDHPERPP